jgi:anti-anti-sigma regulatory factor
MRAASAVDELDLGDHVCWTFGDDRERLQVTARFVQQGLDQGHRVVYFTHDLSPEAVTAGLRSQGVPVAEAVAAGQLQVASAAQGYLAGGRFDAATMPGAWRAEQDAARRSGWHGLRAIGDMSWAASPFPGAEDLVAYEARVNRFFAEGFAAALCLYDRRLFTAAQLAPIVSAHPGTRGAAAPDGWQPGLRMRYTADPPRLDLSGEIDLANRQAVEAMLDALLDDLGAGSATVAVDMTKASVYDVATASSLADAVRSTDGRLHLLGASPMLTRLMALVNDVPTEAEWVR